MANEMLNFMLSEARSIEPPTDREVTNSAISAYRKGLDQVNRYRGHPAALWHAIEQFVHTECEPLFYAGVAYALISASYISGRSYDLDGLEIAYTWLRKAQEITLDQVDINFIEPYIWMLRGDRVKAAARINELLDQDSYNFYLRVIMMNFYRSESDASQLEDLYRITAPLAKTVERKAYLLSRMGAFYMNNMKPTKSLNYYHQLAQITPGDPWMWHNMSLMYLKQYKLLKAQKCNTMALRLMDFGNAQAVKAEIGRRFGQLFAAGFVVLVIVLTIFL